MKILSASLVLLSVLLILPFASYGSDNLTADRQRLLNKRLDIFMRLTDLGLAEFPKTEIKIKPPLNKASQQRLSKRFSRLMH